MAKIALGTWAWGAGAFGGDTVFGSKTDVETLKPVFDAAMKSGLSLWDTATAYGMGESERMGLDYIDIYWIHRSTLVACKARTRWTWSAGRRG